MEIQKIPNSQSNPEKEKQRWRNQAPDFRIYHEVPVKIDWYWQKKNPRKTDQWNRIESPEINPHGYVPLISDKEGKNIQWRKDNLFTMWQNWTATCKRIKLELSLTPS